MTGSRLRKYTARPAAILSYYNLWLHTTFPPSTKSVRRKKLWNDGDYPEYRCIIGGWRTGSPIQEVLNLNQ